jgi:hypothetical protein
MRRRPPVLLLLTLSLLVAACGSGAAGPASGSTTTATTSVTGSTTSQPAQKVFYTDFDRALLARWDIAGGSCDGMTTVGLSAGEVAVGLGWIWVTDCAGEQLVRFDIQTGEVTGRLDLGACPTDMVITEGYVWLALPELGEVVAVDPETGAIAAVGTSSIDSPIYLAVGSLHVAGHTHYWRVDDFGFGTGDLPWDFNLDQMPVQAEASGRIQALGASQGGGTGLLVGPGVDASTPYDDPNYPTTLYSVGSHGSLTQVGDPLMGYYGNLGVFDHTYLATSTIAGYGQVRDGLQATIPLVQPGRPVAGPPPPGGAGGQPWVWIVQRQTGDPSLVAFPMSDLPSGTPQPAVSPACQADGSTVDAYCAVVLDQSEIARQAGLAAQMDRGAFPMVPFPTATTAPTGGPRVSSCSASYSSSSRTVSGLKATTDPGTTVLLTMQVGDTVYPFLGSAVAGADGQAAFPDLSLDDLTPAVPAGAKVTVIYTPEGFPDNTCTLDIQS